jgi:hypothetical protein
MHGWVHHQFGGNQYSIKVCILSLATAPHTESGATERHTHYSSRPSQMGKDFEGIVLDIGEVGGVFQAPPHPTGLP